MIQEKNIDFKEFYIKEFFNLAQSKVTENIAGENARLLNKLLTFLDSESDTSYGIEKLAQEKGSGELSIFLFDIIDRIGDYPPTVAYDALADIVDDFVNAANIMLEENETVDAVKKVNSTYDSGEVEAVEEAIPEITDEVVEPEQEKTVAEEPTLSFTEFAEQFFFEKLESELPQNEKDELIRFTQILISEDKSSLPDILANLKESLLFNLPGHEGKKFNALNYIEELQNTFKEFVTRLVEFGKSHKDVIFSSVENDRLSMPQKEKAAEAEFAREEIPERPTTIDNILSEYFLSEIDESRQKIGVIFKQLQKQPDDKQNLKDLSDQITSLKEISMIHGYPVIENFCSHLIQELQSGHQKRRSLNYETIPVFENIFETLKKVHLLKDPKKPTQASRKLDTYLEELKSALWSKPEKKTAIQKKKIEESCGLDDKEKLTEIFTDVLHAQKKRIIEGLRDPDSIYPVLAHFSNLEQTLRLIGYNDIAPLFALFAEQIQNMHDAGHHALWAEFISEKFLQFVEAFPAVQDEKHWKKVLKYTEVQEDISLEQPDQLLHIICELEYKNLSSFENTLTKVFSGKDVNARDDQYRHFKRLRENLELVGVEKSVKFADFFRTLFNSEGQVELNNKVQNELKESYKIFLESLEKNGIENDSTELVQVLDEVLKGTAAEEDVTGEILPPEAEEVSEEVEESSDTEEEDLDQIFRQEAMNYLNTAEESLEQIKVNQTNQEAAREIERSIHSLKASARLMGYGEVADLASPLESLCEKLIGHKIENMDEITPILGEGLELLKQTVNDKSPDVNEYLQKLSGINIQISEKIDTEDDQKDKSQASLTEKPLFSTTQEEDEDLLDIFRDESAEFLSIIEDANKKLKSNPGDNESLSQLENASHSLKSAAKMLGFREIGQIGDAIEEIVESVKSGEIRTSETVNQRITDALQMIKSLTTGQKLEGQTFTQLLSSMDVKRIADEQTVSGEDSDTSFFVQEGTDLLERINVDLLSLEKTPDKKELINNLSRNLHTLKGSSQIVGLENIGTIAHLIEEFFDRVNSEKRAIEDDELDVIFQGVDEIQNLISNVKKGNRDESASLKSVIGILERKLHKKGAAKGRARVLREVQADQEYSPEDETKQVIKVTTERLDNLINMAAELVVNKSQLTNYLEKLKEISSKIDTDKRKLKNSTDAINSFLEKLRAEESAPETKDEFIKLSEISGDFKNVVETFDTVVSDFKNITQNFELNLGQISSLTKLLHDDILQVRMVPTTVLFSRFQRAVRDLAKTQKKKINLVVEGETTEMDRAMVESLTDPVMHLVRNAVDHGIEKPDKRKEKDKNEEGTLTLRADRDKNHIIVEVQDDGNGIDTEAIKKAIVRKRLAKKSEVEKMRNDEIIQFIFKPGFTTRKGASKVSGRGVGLDVVAENIRQIKGDISINSTPGEGTIFSIRVPLTLAITQAMLIQSQGEVLAIPIADVEETVELDEKNIVIKDERNYLAIHDEEMPLVEISRFLKYESATEAEQTGKRFTLIIKEKDVKYALSVDKVLRREEIVVKSLGEELNNLEFISGGTILGDGSVILILDVDGISRMVGREYFGKEADFASLELTRQQPVSETKSKKTKQIPKKITIKRRKITDRPPVALIVDDSLSVRKFVSSVLERNKYETKLANDGNEAVGQLESTDFDIIITDLEMPEMSGFELIEKIRNQEKYDQIPIVILTGRAGRESKEKGIKLGANAYIIKPFKENDLMKILEEYIEVE